VQRHLLYEQHHVIAWRSASFEHGRGLTGGHRLQRWLQRWLQRSLQPWSKRTNFNDAQSHLQASSLIGCAVLRDND
jgi:hypothetical protein